MYGGVWFSDLSASGASGPATKTGQSWPRGPSGAHFFLRCDSLPWEAGGKGGYSYGRVWSLAATRVFPASVPHRSPYRCHRSPYPEDNFNERRPMPRSRTPGACWGHIREMCIELQDELSNICRRKMPINQWIQADIGVDGVVP